MEKDKTKKEEKTKKNPKEVTEPKKKEEKTKKSTSKTSKTTTKKEPKSAKVVEVKEEKVTEEKIEKKIKEEAPKKKNKEKKSNKSEVKEKVIKGVGIALIVLAILGLAFWSSKSYGSGIGAYKFTEITIDEYLDYLKDDEQRIVYVARPTCSYCQLETPILKRVASSNKLTVYYLNTQDFYDESVKDYTEDGYKLINSTETFSEGISTPNTLIIKDGKVIDGTYGYVQEEELVDLFTRNGYIK